MVSASVTLGLGLGTAGTVARLHRVGLSLGSSPGRLRLDGSNRDGGRETGATRTELSCIDTGPPSAWGLGVGVILGVINAGCGQSVSNI
jgi:hypothetical protein